MAERGRKPKKGTIKDNEDLIIEWKRQGVTDENVYKMLGVSKSSWYNYLSANEEFAHRVRFARACLASDLKNELIRQALTPTLETKTQNIKKDLETGHEIQYTEITTKEVDGNIGACHMLLKNIDRENWKENWDSYELKTMDYQLREKIAEEKMF